jgi:hypothetical protein
MARAAELAGTHVSPAASHGAPSAPGAAGVVAASSSESAPAASPPQALPALPPLSPLKSPRGPAPLSQAALDAVARLRSYIAVADGTPGSEAAARTLRIELSGVLSGFVDPGQVVYPGTPASPDASCLAVAAQCGGLAPGSNVEAWRGAGTCCNGSTCVQTSPEYAQCVTLAAGESRSRGCSALNSQCGGDWWDGPSCCAAGSGCIYQSQAYSRCLTCAKLYDQWYGRRGSVRVEMRRAR